MGGKAEGEREGDNVKPRFSCEEDHGEGSNKRRGGGGGKNN